MTIKKLKQQLKECSDILTIDDQKEKEIQILTKKLNKLLYKSGKHDAEVAEYAWKLEEKDHMMEIEQCLTRKKFSLEKKRN